MNTPEAGNTMVTITDAQGDFTNYVVTVNSIKLKKADGAVVETLPQATQIDFAQLVDLSEVLSVGQIPSGDYVAASITVDYTGATLIVDDGTADGLAVSPVDANGTAVTQLTLDVQLDNKNHLVITQGRISRLALDFNLLASNTVNTATAKVTVQPFVVASVMPADNKQIRVRGSLSSVDAANSDYVVNVLPFHAISTTMMTSGEMTATGGMGMGGMGGMESMGTMPMTTSSTMNQVTVHTTAQTTYEINGTAFKGAAGLTALAALPMGTMTAAFGSLQTSDMTFTAANVLAGTSLENKSVDRLIGDVIARSGNTFTVRGIEIDHLEGHFEFGHGSSTVTVGPNTVVTEEGQGGNFNVGAISVGQRVEVFGMMTATTNSSVPGSSKMFDATSGRVRLDITPLWGVVSSTVAPTSSGSGSVTLNLQTLDNRSVSAYNFAGTGTGAATDAKPGSYVVNTQSLPLAGLVMNSPTRMFGFVTPFGSAPPNFTAVTLVDFSAVKAELEISWGLRGTTAPFSTENSTQLILDLANPNIGLLHEIEEGPVHIDLKQLTASPLIVPDAASGMQLYSIGHVASHRIENFNTFADFAAALTTTLNGTNVAFTLNAQGTFNSATNTFTAQHVLVIVNN